MVCREVRETGRGTSRTGPSGRPLRHLACRPPHPRRFSLDTGIRLASNRCSGEPGEVPVNEVRSNGISLYDKLRDLMAAEKRRWQRPGTEPGDGVSLCASF